MKKGQARSVVRRVEDLAKKRKASTLNKCHPALFELAPLWKESILEIQALGQNPSTERVAEIEQRFAIRLEEIQREVFRAQSPAPNTFAAQTFFRNDPEMSDIDGIADWIHFERHKVPLKDDLVRRQNNDWEGTNRVLRTVSDMEQLRCGKRIRPFKGNLEHQNMFESFWGFGIEKLSPDELADFFDQFCPCGTEGHEPDALKKHRRRFQRALGALCR